MAKDIKTAWGLRAIQTQRAKAKKHPDHDKTDQETKYINLVIK